MRPWDWVFLWQCYVVVMHRVLHFPEISHGKTEKRLSMSHKLSKEIKPGCKYGPERDPYEDRRNRWALDHTDTMVGIALLAWSGVSPSLSFKPEIPDQRATRREKLVRTQDLYQSHPATAEGIVSDPCRCGWTRADTSWESGATSPQ